MTPPRQPLPPLNTLGYVLADPASALPLLDGGRLLVFSSDAAAKHYRDNVAAGVRHARVIAVALVPLMLAGEAPLGGGVVDFGVDVALRTALEASQLVTLEEVDAARKRKRRRRLNP